MPEVIFTGPAGRIEGQYHPAREKNAPIAIVSHPHPQFGGTMNHQIITNLLCVRAPEFRCLAVQFSRGRAQSGAPSTMARANCPTPPRRLTGLKQSTRRPEAAGLPASDSEPGSECSS